MWLRQLLAVGTGLILSLVFIWLQPFDLDDGSANAIRTVAGRISAFDYPVERSPKTVVVIIDNDYLHSLKASWPMPLADEEGDAPMTHADLLASLADLEPKAIYLNFKYTESREPAQTVEFVETLSSISKTVPIYLAANADASFPQPAVPEILVAQHEAGSQIKFASVLAGRAWGEEAAYPIWSKEEELYTTAATLFRDFCPSSGACALSTQALPLDPQWATPPVVQKASVARDMIFNCDKLQLASVELYESSCAKRETSALQRFFAELMFGTALHPSAPIAVGHIPIVSPSQFGEARVKALFKDAVVFVGTNLGIGDATQSPLQGRLPQVLLHAIAYDNLVVLNAGYVRAEPPMGLSAQSYQAICVLVVAIFVLLARICVLQWMQGKDDARVQLVLTVSEVVTQAVVLAIWIFADASIFHSGAWVWGGILLAIFSGSMFRSVALTIIPWWRNSGRRNASEPASPG